MESIEGHRPAKSFISLFSLCELRILVDSLTGHLNLSYYLWKLELVSFPLCRHCKEENKTTAHLLCYFLVNKSVRRDS